MKHMQRFDKAFLVVIVMLGIISVSMAFMNNITFVVFPLILVVTMMIIYLSVIADNDVSRKRKI